MPTVCCCSRSLAPGAPPCVCRAKLFEEGDRLATSERTRRLKGQYKRMSDLRWFIYWTDVGEVGYLDFQKRLKRKRLAQQMTNVELGLDVEVTPDKVNKMISKAIEAQEKADQAAKRRRTYNYNNGSPKKNNQRTSRTNPNNRRYQQQPRNNRGNTGSTARSSNRQSSNSKPSSSRKHQSRHRF